MNRTYETYWFGAIFIALNYKKKQHKKLSAHYHGRKYPKMRAVLKLGGGKLLLYMTLSALLFLLRARALTHKKN